jgi:hypothetical protein
VARKAFFWMAMSRQPAVTVFFELLGGSKGDEVNFHQAYPGPEGQL